MRNLRKRRSSQNWNGSQNVWDSSNLVPIFLFALWFSALAHLFPRIIMLPFDTACLPELYCNKIACKTRASWFIHPVWTYQMSSVSNRLHQVCFPSRLLETASRTHSNRMCLPQMPLNGCSRAKSVRFSHICSGLRFKLSQGFTHDSLQVLVNSRSHLS